MFLAPVPAVLRDGFARSQLSSHAASVCTSSRLRARCGSTSAATRWAVWTQKECAQASAGVQTAENVLDSEPYHSDTVEKAIQNLIRQELPTLLR